MQVTVIIPTFNRVDTIDQTIKSVYEQSLKPTEILIVDDASKDDLVAYVKEKHPKIKVLQNDKNKGAAISRNIGAAHAKTEFIAFLDSDDRWHKDHLKKTIGQLTTKKIDGVCTQFFLHRGEQTLKTNFQPQKKLNVLENIFSNTQFDTRTSTFVFRTDAFQKVKFDPDLRKYQDWDLAMCFDQKFQFEMLDVHTVDIIVDGQQRMSDNFNKEAFLYFYDKHKENIEDNIKFIFLIKSLYRTSSKENRMMILKKMKELKLNVRNELIYFLLSKKLINTTLLKSLKNLMNANN